MQSIACVAVLTCALAFYAVAYLRSATPSNGGASTIPTPRPETASALSSADKVATIRAYYDDVSSRRYDDAYGRLEAGSYESSSALSSRYCEVSRFALTAFQDVPDNPALNATIVGYSNDGTATTYKGTINLVHDERTGQWLLQRPALDRVDGPKLVGLPCGTPEPLAAATVQSAVPETTVHAAVFAPVAAHVAVRAPVAAQPLARAATVESRAVTLTDISGDYWFSGQGNGDNTIMLFKVVNDTDTTWTVKIKKGTRLEPADSSVQTMVVTEDIEVEVEPHEEKNDVKIEVACLDIVKDAPSSENARWTASDSQQLADYIDCSEISPQDGLLQAVLWVARGASREDFIQHMSQSDAQHTDVLLSAARPIVERCGSLSSI